MSSVINDIITDIYILTQMANRFLDYQNIDSKMLRDIISTAKHELFRRKTDPVKIKEEALYHEYCEYYYECFHSHLRYDRAEFLLRTDFHAFIQKEVPEAIEGNYEAFKTKLWKKWYPEQ